MNLRSSESSPQIAPLDETIKEMCWGALGRVGPVGVHPQLGSGVPGRVHIPDICQGHGDNNQKKIASENF